MSAAAVAIVGIVTALAALFLALRGLRSHGLPFETKAVMAGVWVAIIAGLAFVFSRFVV